MEFDINDGIEYAIILLIISTVSWISNRETEKSLIRARKSEKDLEFEKENLELLVNERTDQLKQIQLEKMINIYKFVEFGRLSSGLFHDLMTPLTSISIALEELKNTDKMAHMLTVQTHLALKSSRRINDLLNHAKNHINIPEKQFKFNIRNEISLVANFLSSKLSKANVNLEIDCPTSIFIFGNPVVFNHIVTNLISNAIDSYEDCCTDNKKIILKFTEINNELFFKVQDFGCGIPKENLSKIFEPFYTTKDYSKGVGIGLSATKHSIEKYFKGIIGVISETKIGTTFNIKMPNLILTNQKTSENI